MSDHSTLPESLPPLAAPPPPVQWSAQWIGKRTDPAHRNALSADSDHVAWAEPGHWVGQTFTAPGPFVAVGLDLVSDDDAVRGVLELCDADGTVLAEQVIERGIVRWDRFAHFLELPDALGAGEYLLRLRVVQGRIGWPTLSTPPPDQPDDGVSPLPVTGRAVRDGGPEPGVRVIGVETVPAPNPVFRTSFVVPEGVREAELSAVGLGYGEFRVNGQPVTEDVLEPAQTTYDRTVLYRTYDVTALLRAGENTLTAELGRGFYAARGANTWGWNFARWHREPVLLAQLEYRDAAGERHVVASGGDWEAAEGAVTSDLLYTGETTDLAHARRAAWEPALVVAPPGGALRPATAPPVRRSEPLAPVASTPRDGVVVHDFGEVLAGRVRLTAVGEAGAEVVVRYAEQLDADGVPHCHNALAAGESQVDRLVLGDSGAEVTWEPRFSYKGFRYVGVEVHGGATVTDVRAVRLQTQVARVGEFACSDELLTWIVDATGRTFRNNLHGVPTDTPVYEKNGWTADAHLATEAVLHHWDLRAPLRKWLDDHVDARDEHGVVPQIVPSPDWGRAADPAWSGSMVLIPWYLYREYGDRDVLERCAEPIRTYADRLLALTADGLWPHHSWGDWLSPGHHFAPEGPMPTATMVLLHLVQRVADIGDVLGDTGAERYRAAAAQLATAYHQRFFDTATGTYRAPGVGYRQAMNVLPLAFGAVPAEHVTSVAEGLFADIEHRTGGHLDCGAVAAKHLLPVLAAHGRPDLAITVATQRTRPGWGPWFEAGAATLMESWDETARSHNHYFLGAASAWIQQAVGGLRPTSPGWATFDVAPLADDRLTWARTAHTTVRGRAAVAWRRTGDAWELDVEVPETAVATVRVPGHPETSLAGGRHALRLPATDEARSAAR